MLSASFYKQSPTRLAAEESRRAIEDVSFAVGALKKLLAEVRASPSASAFDVRAAESAYLSARAETLLETNVTRLDVLKSRLRQHLRLVEIVYNSGETLWKSTSRFRLQVTEVDEEIVNAKLTDVKLRTELDKLRHDLMVSKKHLASLSLAELEEEDSVPADF